MIGGPWLGIAVFVVIAIGLGWGVHWFFEQAQSASDFSTSTEQRIDDKPKHDFDPDTVYQLKQPLLVGFTSDGRIALLPARDELPRHAPNRRAMPTIQEVRGWDDQKLKQNDLIGIAQRHTRVRFTDALLDPDNMQTRFLVLVQALDGRFEGLQPMLGMHLETADTDKETGDRRYVPRDDLFEPVQSQTLTPPSAP